MKTFTAITKFSNSHEGMRILAAGPLSNAVVDSQGLWTWGCNDGGGLGRDADENFPALVKFPSKVTIMSVSLGDDHGCCSSLGGQVYIWGTYRDKDNKAWFPTTCLVNGDRKVSGPGTSRPAPEELMVPKDILKVSSGGSHDLLLAFDGTVYSLGLGECSQLGRRVDTQLKFESVDPQDEPAYNIQMIHKDHLFPLPIDLKEPAKNIGCGKSFCSSHC